MPHRLGVFDMTMTFLMVMFFINNPVRTVGAGIATFTYWIIGALVFFLPCIIATSQLGTMFPNEGSLYNWTQKAPGSFWSFFVGISFWTAGILGMVSSAGIAVTFLQGLNSTWLAEPRFQGVLIVLILIFSSILSMQPFRVVQTLVNMTMLLMLCVIVLLGLAALLWLVLGHPAVTNFTRVSDLTIHPGNYVLFSTIIFAFLGVNVPMTMGGAITMSLFNVVATTGWSAVNAIVGGQLLTEVSGGTIARPVAVLIIAILTTIVGIYGYKYIHSYARYAWIPTVVIFLILTVVVGPKVSIIPRVLLRTTSPMHTVSDLACRCLANPSSASIVSRGRYMAQ